jgi:Zn-dependent M28 family amino/carboxypeptidase
VAAQGVNAFSGAEAFELLGRIVKLERHYGAPGRREAIETLRRELASWTDEVTLQSFGAVEPRSGVRYELVNIVGRQRPAAARRTLLASHWDSRLWAEQDPDPRKRALPGEYANDSGSGVAVVLQLAKRTRAMRAAGIDYVLFDGEEFGREGSSDYCQGSKHYARMLSQAPASVPRPREVIALDMVGDKDLAIYQEVTSLGAAPELTRDIWEAARALGHGELRPQPKYSIVDDQTPFQQLGIPAVLLIDYDYPPWHTHADTLDKTCARSLQIVGSVLLRVLADREAKAGG